MIFSLVLAYLMGSICSAVIVCRTFSLPDPREQGSKNPGATNVLRIAGKQYAAIVMIVDVLKGTIPVVIAHALGASPVTVAFTALAAVIGHMYPIFFGFQGGKGVATAIGGFLGFHFVIGILVAATWLIVAKLTRYSSLASIISMCMAPLFALFITGQVDIFPPFLLITILILFKHRNNINRLMDGSEPKIKFKHTIMEEVMDTLPTDAHETAEPLVKPKHEKNKKENTNE